MFETTIAIVGAGIGGVYLAAELGLKGCKLRLCDRDDARLAEIRARGGIEVEGERAGFAAIERVTTDPAEALDGADIVVLCTGGTFQEGAARDLAPYLRDGQTILLIQGNTGGSLVVRRALDHAGCQASVDVAEMDNYPIPAGGSAPLASARSSPSAGCRSPRFPATASTRSSPNCRRCSRRRCPRRASSRPAS